MNKNVIIIGMAVLLLSVGLSGCIEDPFEGTWTDGILEISYVQGVGLYITELTFTDGTAYLSLKVRSKFIAGTAVNGTYETEGNELHIHISSGVTFSFKYSFDTEDGKDILYLDGVKFTKC